MAIEILTLEHAISCEIAALNQIYDNLASATTWCGCYRVSYFQKQIDEPSRQFKEKIETINYYLNNINSLFHKNYPLLPSPNYFQRSHSYKLYYLDEIINEYAEINTAAIALNNQLNPSKKHSSERDNSCSEVVLAIFLIIFGVMYMFRTSP